VSEASATCTMLQLRVYNPNNQMLNISASKFEIEFLLTGHGTLVACKVHILTRCVVVLAIVSSCLRVILPVEPEARSTVVALTSKNILRLLFRISCDDLSQV
jgi:hypothetical protein